MSAATTVKHDSPVVENVSDSELLPSMQVVCGGEGYIDFKTGKYSATFGVSFFFFFGCCHS